MSQDLVLLALASTGAFIGMMAVATAGAGMSEGESLSRGKAMLSVFVVLLLLVSSLWGTGASARHLLSATYGQHASLALSQGDTASAQTLNTRSQSLERNGTNMRLGVEIDLAKLQQLLNAPAATASADDVRTQFQNLLADAINNQAKGAVAVEPKNYQSYTEFARIYDLLVPLKIQGAYDNDKQMYISAMALNPTNPTIPLLLARLEATQDLNNNLGDIQKLLNQSLTLKSNYTDALLFTEQLAVAENDLGTATAAAKAAVSSAPTQAPLWFQLGLFYYVGGAVPNAVSSFEQAVKLIPNYANAKYFLGLSYYREGRNQDAINEFKDIQQTNVDNAEVQLILANLEAGKNPFAGTKPPVSTPAARSSAPIQE